MKEVKVRTTEDDLEHLELEENVPAKIGRKTRMKIDADAEGSKDGDGDVQNEEYVIKDAVSNIEKAKMYLVENMLDESGVDVTINDLTLSSYDELAQLYWPQIQGKKKVSEED